jgi:transcriptional regulator with XRE-family HTH domain
VKNATSQTSLRRTFAANLRAQRVSQGISQEELAEKACLDRTYVSSVERGQRNIGIDNIEKLAQALGVDALELMRRT